MSNQALNLRALRKDFNLKEASYIDVALKLEIPCDFLCYSSYYRTHSTSDIILNKLRSRVSDGDLSLRFVYSNSERKNICALYKSKAKQDDFIIYKEVIDGITVYISYCKNDKNIQFFLGYDGVLCVPSNDVCGYKELVSLFKNETALWNV